VALARWTAGKTSEIATGAVKGAAYYMPLAGGKAWENRARGLKAVATGAFYDVAKSEDFRGGVINPVNWLKMAARGSISSDKRAEDLEEIAGIKKELADKSVTAKAFLTYEKDGDRMGYGDIKRALGAQVEVLQERSDIKTARIKADAKREMMAGPRVQDGKVKRDAQGNFKTLAQDIEENKVKSETAEARLSKLAPQERLKLIIASEEIAKKTKDGLDHGTGHGGTIIGDLLHEAHEAHEIEHTMSSRFSTLESKSAQKSYEKVIAEREAHETREAEKEAKIKELMELLNNGAVAENGLVDANKVLQQLEADLAENESLVAPNRAQLEARHDLTEKIQNQEKLIQNRRAEAEAKFGAAATESLAQEILKLIGKDSDIKDYKQRCCNSWRRIWPKMNLW
jgi:hypothetical protein